MFSVIREMRMRRSALPVSLIALLFFSTFFSLPSPAFAVDKSLPSLTAADSSDESIVPPEEDRSFVTLKQFKPTSLQWFIARNLEAVHMGDMHPKDFFKALAKHGGTMFDVMEVKATVEKLSGTSGLQELLGERYASGGSKAEKILLTWRREMVEEGIRDACRKTGGEALGKNGGVLLAKIGAWANQDFDALTVAGDIDFSFVGLDDAVLRTLNEHFTEFIHRVTGGLSPHDFDTVSTRHGNATTDVYVGAHGAEFGRAAMIKGDLFPLASTGPGAGVSGEEAINTLLVLSESNENYKNAVADTDKISLAEHSTEPGLSMELIRHFEGDIVKGKNQFGPMELFLKSAKYLNRSDISARNDVGHETARDAKLSSLVNDLVILKNQKSPDASKILARIEAHYGKGTLPYKADVRPTANGQLRAVVKANDKLMNDLFKQVRSAMWHNAQTVFDSKYNTMKIEFDELKKINEESAKRGAKPDKQTQMRMDNLKKDLQTVKDMVEVEYKVFGEKKLAVSGDIKKTKIKVDQLFEALDKELGTGVARRAPLDVKKQLEYLRRLTTDGGPEALKLAAAHAINSTMKMMNSVDEASLGRVDTILDFMDQKLLGKLRGEESFEAFLEDYSKTKNALEQPGSSSTGKKSSLRNKLKQFNSEFVSRTNKRLAEVEFNMNARWHKSMAGRAVKKVNVGFSDHLARSSVDRAGVKAMGRINLIMELDAYYSSFNQQGWQGLATEFFRRRVPFGSTLDHTMQGNYLLATWDFTTTLLPPLALPEAAWSLGTMAAENGVKLYWSTELTLYVDELYDKATFKLVSKGKTTRYGEGKVGDWKLVKVRIKGKEFVIDDYLARSRDLVRMYQEDLKKKLEDREFHDYNIGVFGTYDEDEILRRNLNDTDPMLVMLDGLIKGEYLGERTKAHFRDKRMARWAMVRHLFIKRMIADLEKRRQAELAIDMGQVKEIRKELFRVLRELKIRKEATWNLIGEAGNRLVGKARDILIWMVDVKRTQMDQGWNETEYVKATKVILRYTEKYTAILNLRGQLEASFARGKPEDAGLRVLTGPVLLAAQPESDEKIAEREVEQFRKITRELHQELTAIKQEALPGSELSGEFDESMFSRIYFHDIWWAEWQRFFSLSHGNEAQQDKSLKQAQYHGTERKKLLAEFKEYYLSRKLDSFAIKGYLEKSGEAITVPVFAGQKVRFQATAPYASEYPPRARGLTWTFHSPDSRELLTRSCHYDVQGQVISGSASGCEPQSGANYQATFRFEIKDVESGAYRVSLRHYLLDEPDISITAHQDFRVQSQRVDLAPLKIAATMSGGGAISKAVTAGDSVLFSAVASLADSGEKLAVRRSLTWRFISPDGIDLFTKTCRYAVDGALLPGSDQQCTGQSGSDYQAQLKYTTKNMKSGRYTISLKHALLDSPEISVSDQVAFPVQAQEIKLSEFNIVGYMQGGGEIHGPVGDGDQLRFEAEISHPEFVPAAISELIWQLFDADGNEKIKLRKRVQVAESGKRVKYAYGPIGINTESLRNGVYRVSLTHRLYDNPEVSKQAVYSFKLLLPLRIKGLRIVSNPEETMHKPTLYSHEQPIAVLSYEMAEGIEQADVMFTLKDKASGELLSQKGGVQKRKEGEQGTVLKQAVMRYKQGRVKAGSVGEVVAVVTSADGQTQHASQSFRVEDFKISMRLPSSLEAEESSAYSISVPDSFKAPYTVDLAPSGSILLSASSTGSLSGKVTAMGRDTASTARVKVKVTDSEGRTGTTSGSIQIKAKPEEKEVASTDDKRPPPSSTPPDFNQMGEMLSIIAPIIGQMGGDPTMGGLMQGFPAGAPPSGASAPSPPSSGATSGCKVPARYRIPGDALMSVQLNRMDGQIYTVTLYPLETGGGGHYFTKQNISKVVGQGKFGPGCSVVRHGSWYYYNREGRMIKGGTFINDVEQ